MDAMPPDLGRHREEAVRITTASVGRDADINARQRRYLWSMGVRTLCFVGAIVADGWLRWVLVAAALILPYVAVVMANNSGSKSDGFALTEGGASRPELGSGTDAARRSAPDVT